VSLFQGKNRMRASLALWLAIHTVQADAAWMQEAQGGLRIVIVEGEDAIFNVRQRVAREAIIQVEDENRKPVAGAILTLTAPRQGASVVFGNGLNNITLTTDEFGRAVVRGMRPNGAQGKFSIRITAVKDNLKGSTEWQVSNVAGAAAAGGVSAKMIALIAAAGAGAVAGAVAATRGNGSPAAPPPTVISPGTVTVGPPR
jgi:hypothetical protein